MVHSDVLRLKLKKRNNLLLKLAASSWGADVPTLRTTALALVFSAAEYHFPSPSGFFEMQLNEIRELSDLRYSIFYRILKYNLHFQPSV